MIYELSVVSPLVLRWSSIEMGLVERFPSSVELKTAVLNGSSIKILTCSSQNCLDNNITAFKCACVGGLSWIAGEKQTRSFVLVVFSGGLMK